MGTREQSWEIAHSKGGKGGKRGKEGKGGKRGKIIFNLFSEFLFNAAHMVLMPQAPVLAAERGLAVRPTLQ